MMLSMPAATASSTPYWMIGLSTSGNISFGCAFVAGRNRVPRPAAGNTALRTIVRTSASYLTHSARQTCCRRHPSSAEPQAVYIDFLMLDSTYVRDHFD